MKTVRLAGSFFYIFTLTMTIGLFSDKLDYFCCLTLNQSGILIKVKYENSKGMVYYRFSRHWKDGKNGTGIQRRTRVRTERIPKRPAKNPWSWTAPWAGLPTRPIGRNTDRAPSAPRIVKSLHMNLTWSCRTEWFLCPVFSMSRLVE